MQSFRQNHPHSLLTEAGALLHVQYSEILNYSLGDNTDLTTITAMLHAKR